MIIEVYSVTDSNISRIYEDAVDVVNSQDSDSFTVFTINHGAYQFSYKDFCWHELTLEEARANGIYTKENENLKYKLSVDDSGYGMNCTNCERIIFIKPKAGDSVELDPKKLSELDWININGIKFKREK